MKTLNKILLLTTTLILSANVKASNKVWNTFKNSDIIFTVGAGHKIQETHYNYTSSYGGKVEGNDPLSARFNLGLNTDINKRFSIQYGISHHSQWLVGWPVDRKGEYYKTEYYLDITYKFKIRDLF